MSSNPNAPRILLLGRNGQVGFELRHTLAPLGDLVVWGRKEANLEHPQQLTDLVEGLKPDVIVNAAAYTAVDRAEEEKKLAMTVNCASPGILADYSRKNDALLVHYSTDYVFDGSGSGPYTEEDETHPVNAYGESKLGGENAIIESGCRHLIFRTAWVYSGRGSNFLRTMLRLGREREELGIVNDQFGSPTWARMIAEATAQALAQVLVQPESLKSGIYNLSAGGCTTWHEFALEIFATAQRHDELVEELKIRNVRAIPTSEYPTPAKRPANSELSHEKTWETFRLRMPHWKDSLHAMMETYPSV